MPDVTAIYHRTKSVSIYPIEGNRFLIDAMLHDEVHDVHVEVEIVHPTLEIVAARSEIRNGPFTEVCNLTAPNVNALVGLKVERGFTQKARAAVGGPGGCHRVSELLVEVAQAAYQLHFVRYFTSLPQTVRDRKDVPVDRRQAVLDSIPGMRNTCFSYHEDNDALIAERARPLQRRHQRLPRRQLD